MTLQIFSFIVRREVAMETASPFTAQPRWLWRRSSSQLHSARLAIGSSYVIYLLVMTHHNQQVKTGLSNFVIYTGF